MRRVAKGKIVDQSGKPVFNAAVYIANSDGTQKDGRGTTTDFSGNWQLDSVDPSELVGVAHLSFENQVVPASGLVNGDSLLQLRQSTTTLPTFTVKASKNSLAILGLTAVLAAVIFSASSNLENRSIA